MVAHLQQQLEQQQLLLLCASLCPFHKVHVIHELVGQHRGDLRVSEIACLP